MILKINEHVVTQKYAVVFGRTKKFKLKKKIWLICDCEKKSINFSKQNRRQINNKKITKKSNVFLIRFNEKLTAEFDIWKFWIQFIITKQRLLTRIQFTKKMLWIRNLKTIFLEHWKFTFYCHKFFLTFA